MKKRLCLILAALLLLSTAGCVANEPDIEVPVSFYYRTSNMDYTKVDGVISKEIREGKGLDLKALLELYLKGPEDFDLQRPFPIRTALIDLEVRDDTAYLLLSDAFASMTGLELSIACACLTMTVCGITGAQQANISCTADVLLDGYPSITMSPKDLLLIDDSNIVVDPD